MSDKVNIRTGMCNSITIITSNSHNDDNNNCNSYNCLKWRYDLSLSKYQNISEYISDSIFNLFLVYNPVNLDHFACNTFQAVFLQILSKNNSDFFCYVVAPI